MKWNVILNDSPVLRLPVLLPVFSACKELLCFVCRLVCGDVEGQFSKLFNRVNSIQKKAGQFDVSSQNTVVIIILKCPMDFKQR